MITLRKTSAVWMNVLVCWLLLSCQDSNDPTPGSSADQLIVDKWWCPTGTYSQQYFGADGSWQQRLKTTDKPDTGKWSFSTDKKTISISDVKGGTTTQLLTQWSYTVTKLEANTLNLNYSGIDISYKPCP